MRFSGGGKLIFPANGAVLDGNGTKLYDILPRESRSKLDGLIQMYLAVSLQFRISARLMK